MKLLLIVIGFIFMCNGDTCLTLGYELRSTQNGCQLCQCNVSTDICFNPISIFSKSIASLVGGTCPKLATCLAIEIADDSVCTCDTFKCSDVPTTTKDNNGVDSNKTTTTKGNTCPYDFDFERKLDTQGNLIGCKVCPCNSTLGFPVNDCRDPISVDVFSNYVSYKAFVIQKCQLSCENFIIADDSACGCERYKCPDNNGCLSSVPYLTDKLGECKVCYCDNGVEQCALPKNVIPKIRYGCQLGDKCDIFDLSEKDKSIGCNCDRYICMQPNVTDASTSTTSTTEVPITTTNKECTNIGEFKFKKINGECVGCVCTDTFKYECRYPKQFIDKLRKKCGYGDKDCDIIDLNNGISSSPSNGCGCLRFPCIDKTTTKEPKQTKTDSEPTTTVTSTTEISTTEISTTETSTTETSTTETSTTETSTTETSTTESTKAEVKTTKHGTDLCANKDPILDSINDVCKVCECNPKTGEYDTCTDPLSLSSSLTVDEFVDICNLNIPASTNVCRLKRVDDTACTCPSFECSDDPNDICEDKTYIFGNKEYICKCPPGLYNNYGKICEPADKTRSPTSKPTEKPIQAVTTIDIESIRIKFGIIFEWNLFENSLQESVFSLAASYVTNAVVLANSNVGIKLLIPYFERKCYVDDTYINDITYSNATDIGDLICNIYPVLCLNGYLRIDGYVGIIFDGNALTGEEIIEKIFLAGQTFYDSFSSQITTQCNSYSSCGCGDIILEYANIYVSDDNCEIVIQNGITNEIESTCSYQLNQSFAHTYYISNVLILFLIIVITIIY